MHLEIKHLAAYLPYGLTCQTGELSNCTLLGINQDNAYFSEYNYQTEHCGDHVFVRPAMWLKITNYMHHKPILRPLSEWHIVHNGTQFLSPYFLSMNDMDGGVKENILSAPYDDIQLLLVHHIDVFGLIDAGLAIDINTLNNPS